MRARAAECAARCLSSRPELLYNIAASLQRLGRPGEAAKALGKFIELRIDDPSRGEVEARIRALEDAQQLLDRERMRATAELTNAPAPTKPASPAPRPLYKRWWLWTAVGAAAVGVGLGVGLGLGLGGERYPTASDTTATVRF